MFALVYNILVETNKFWRYIYIMNTNTSLLSYPASLYYDAKHTYMPDLLRYSYATTRSKLQKAAENG